MKDGDQKNCGREDGRPQVAVIAGAGPAGLTAALELARRSNIVPLVFECDAQVGGISKTVVYRGNRMDLGGHRFFSKSEWVMRWWQDILPICDTEFSSGHPTVLQYQNSSHPLIVSGATPRSEDAVMLVRRRLSRIFYRRRFFDYPLKLDAGAVANMGLIETLRIGMSYVHAQVGPRSPESSLEDFLINRFGTRLYRTFFKDYTEKVWGVPCREISPDWGAQRIKGLSITSALMHALAKPFGTKSALAQQRTETSLIEKFLYPKFGPGQMWEEAARRAASLGAEIHLSHRVVGIERNCTRITAVTVHDDANDSTRTIPCDFFISTMPVKEVTRLLEPHDAGLLHLSSRLPYRDFMTAGLLLRKMKAIPGRSTTHAPNGMPPDNWIYIQEADVKIGRLQIFNNWSPALVADPDTIWLGLEYFCREGDELWAMPDAQFLSFAALELEKLGLIDRRDVIDGTVVRVPKAYPAYFGEYREFGRIRNYLEQFVNLYPVGRNGMHRYNNQDHSMLAANAAVTSILNAGAKKSDIWNINTEVDYHEENAPVS